MVPFSGPSPWGRTMKTLCDRCGKWLPLRDYDQDEVNWSRHWEGTQCSSTYAARQQKPITAQGGAGSHAGREAAHQQVLEQDHGPQLVD